ncbi:MAG TPA: lysophospholipid acyltransferase family protein [Terriglobales bacterium]|nr:lysophospholipid acyltransferase family protein [Terriglobales bacterium]
MRTVATLIFWVILVPLTALWGFPLTFLTGDVTALYRAAMWIALTGVRIAGVRWQVEGTERLGERNYIFMSNHVSNLDPPLLIPLIPHRTSVLVKKELFKIPILGKAMLMAKLVPIDRSNRDAAIASVRDAEQVVREGLNMTVFPEGTRSPDGRLQALKKGAFYLATDTQVPIVPITLVGTEELLPKGKKIVKPGKARVVFHPPIDPRQFADRDALIAAVRTAIGSALPPERRGKE